jgi:hypothetical protein
MTNLQLELKVKQLEQRLAEIESVLPLELKRQLRDLRAQNANGNGEQ